MIACLVDPSSPKTVSDFVPNKSQSYATSVIMEEQRHTNRTGQNCTQLGDTIGRVQCNQ